MRREVSENDSYPLTEVLLEGRNDLPRIDGIVVGALSRFDDSGAPCVVFAGWGSEGLPARSTVALTSADQGREVALMFESGDPRADHNRTDSSPCSGADGRSASRCRTPCIHRRTRDRTPMRPSEHHSY